MKKLLASLLAVLTLLSTLSLTAFAANGPSNAMWDDSFYIAYISLYNHEISANYGIFRNNEVDNSAVAGATYDRAANTLTLKDFNHPELNLETNMMGDDFKLKVIGNCTLASIAVWGDNYGGSMLVTGTGTLNVNTDSASEYAVILYPEGCSAKLSFDGNVKANLYGSKGVAAIIGANKNDSKTGFAFADGKSHTVASRAQYNYNPKTVVGYLYKDLEKDTIARVGYKATIKGDSSLYAVTPYYNDSDEIESYGVKKVVYSKKLRLYLTDVSYDSRELSPEQLESEGFIFEYEEKQQEWPESINSDYAMTRMRASEYTSSDSKKYYKWTGGYLIDDVDTDSTWFEATPINGVENEYLFTVTDDSVNTDELSISENEINGYYRTEEPDCFVGQKAIRKSDSSGIYTYTYYTSTDDQGNKTDGYEVTKYIYLEDLGAYIRDTSFGDYSSFYGCSFYGTKDMTVAEWEDSDFEPCFPTITEQVALYNPSYLHSTVYHHLAVYADKNGKEYAVVTDYSVENDNVQESQTVLNMEKIDELDNAYWLTVNNKLKASDLTPVGEDIATGKVDYMVDGTSLKYTGNGSNPADTSKSIANANITNIKGKVYTGKALTQSPTIKLGGKTLKNGTDYTLSYKNNINAGKATLTIKGKGSYTGTVKTTFTIAKAPNAMSISYVKALTTKAGKTVKGVVSVKKAKGTVSYKTNNKKFTVKSGKLTVAKGTKKGKYTVKLTITAKGNANYNKATKTLKIKVTVK